jgi:hypothetical protein
MRSTSKSGYLSRRSGVTRLSQPTASHVTGALLLSLPPVWPSTDRPKCNSHPFGSHHPSLADRLFVLRTRKLAQTIGTSVQTERSYHQNTSMSKPVAPPSPQEIQRKLSIHSTPKQPRVSAKMIEPDEHTALDLFPRNLERVPRLYHLCVNCTC